MFRPNWPSSGVYYVRLLLSCNVVFTASASGFLICVVRFVYGSVCGCPVCSCLVVSVLCYCPAVTLRNTHLKMASWAETGSEQKKVLSNKGSLNQLLAPRRNNNPLSRITQCNRMLKCNIIHFASLQGFGKWDSRRHWLNKCVRCQSQSQSYVTTDGQSANLSWNKAPIWGLRPVLYYCLTVTGFLMWGALSDERTGLSFARVRVRSSKSFVSMYNLQFTCY
jgi:hypothetical protein